MQVDTHRSQCYRGGSKTDEASIAGVRLMDRVRIVVAEFVNNLGYPVVVLRLKRLSNEALELECAAFALVIELIVKRFRDVRVHVDILRRLPLHVAATGSSWCEAGGGWALKV